MNFISIPKNGSSWRKPLCYEADATDDSAQELRIAICLTDTKQVVGRKVLYGTSHAEFDIAPYLRTMAQAAMFSEQTSIANSRIASIVSSPSAMRVHVVVNDVVSESRVFFRESFIVDAGRVLTELPDSRPIALGEVIRLTAVASRNMKISVKRFTPTSEEMENLVAMPRSLPQEVIIPTANYDPTTTRIEVVVWCDAVPVKTFNYRVVERPVSAVRLVWNNSLGGVDSYTFPSSHRVEYKSIVDDITVGNTVSSICREASVLRRVKTLPSSSEMEALAHIVFADTLYREERGELIPVKLKTRNVEFDEHDALHRLSLDIEDSWKGGEL